MGAQLTLPDYQPDITGIPVWVRNIISHTPLGIILPVAKVRGKSTHTTISHRMGAPIKLVLFCKLSLLLPHNPLHCVNI